MNLRKDHYRLAHGWPSGSVRRTHTLARPCKGPKASVNPSWPLRSDPGRVARLGPSASRWRRDVPARLPGNFHGHACLWVYSSAGLGPRVASLPGRNPETKAPPPGRGRPTGTQPASLLRSERGGFNVPGAALLAAWRPRGARGLCRPSFYPFPILEDPGRCL